MKVQRAILVSELSPAGVFRNRRQPNSKLDESFITETIILNMQEENYEKLIHTFVAWARFGDLFDYDEESKTLSLSDWQSRCADSLCTSRNVARTVRRMRKPAGKRGNC